ILPMLNFEKDEFTEIKDDQEFWTDKATQYAKRFIQQIVAIDKALRQESSPTPPPTWAKKTKGTKKEYDIEQKLAGINTKIEELATQREGLKEELTSASSIKNLLYEKGKPLEWS